MKKKFPNLSVGRGEKLSVKKGAGLTAKGRNFFYDIFKLGKSETDPDWKAWHFTTKDNPQESQTLKEFLVGRPQLLQQTKHRPLCLSCRIGLWLHCATRLAKRIHDGIPR